MATATATATPTVTSTSNVLFHVDHGIGRVFSWSSVGLAVLTAFLQGLVTAIAIMTEQSSRWTIRFRLALYEHWWWTAVSALLLCSLVMNALSFASGTGGEPISVLALSATTFIAIVQYMIPSWQERHYTKVRWLAWTGDSRTAILKRQAGYCGNAESWKSLVREKRTRLNDLQSTPSDIYGWHITAAPGIRWDPSDILSVVGSNNPLTLENGDYHAGLYDDGDTEGDRVSLKWGREQHFRRRVSRAVSSMPRGLLRSSPATIDGYDGKGLTLAMGILGRNKGLNPKRMVFDMSSSIFPSYMENFSTWAPRPAKVLRSFYYKTLDGQYNGLGSAYVLAAVELALLLADMPHWAVEKWLSEGLEHQSLETNRFLAGDVLKKVLPEERQNALAAHYESSYVSMIISLNNMNPGMKNRRERGADVVRPDILCTGLLLKARGDPEPSWWRRTDICERRANEVALLTTEIHWKKPMACLLGLNDWPEGFENNSCWWNGRPSPDTKTLTPSQRHATDTNRELLDRRAAERRNGTRGRGIILTHEQVGEDVISDSSTRVASNDNRQDTGHTTDTDDMHSQPVAQSNEQTRHADTTIETLETHQHTSVVDRSSLPSIGGATIARPKPNTGLDPNVLRVRDADRSQNRSTRNRVSDGSDYELETLS